MTATLTCIIGALFFGFATIRAWLVSDADAPYIWPFRIVLILAVIFFLTLGYAARKYRKNL